MKIKKFLKAVAISAIILRIALPQTPAVASAGSSVPIFGDFLNAVSDGESNVIRGVYVPGVLAYPVVQQSPDDPGEVTSHEGEVSQFGMAARYQVVGLLAHNNLAGAAFFNLKIGQEVRIVYGNGRVEYYVVDRLDRYMVIQFGSRDMKYLDLGTDKVQDTQQVFSRFYQGSHHVTFQTCIELGGNSTWGRLFVTAVPVPLFYIKQLRIVNLPDFQRGLGLLAALSW